MRQDSSATGNKSEKIKAKALTTQRAPCQGGSNGTQRPCGLHCSKQGFRSLELAATESFSESEAVGVINESGDMF